MKFVLQHKNPIFLFLIILLGACFRFYAINWDQGFHLHPDERAIVMFTVPLHFPSSLQEFFSVQSPLNPHFFAYGNFPLYLLKIVALFASVFDPLFNQYDKINLVGRILSACVDLGTIGVLFKLAKKVFSYEIALWAAFFYAISVLPIQLSHFYAVDTLLTFLILRTIYQLILYYENPSIKNALYIGVFLGLSLVTKISSIVLMASIGITLLLDFLFIFFKSPHKPKQWFYHIPIIIRKLIIHGLIIMIITAVIFIIFQPYALIDFHEYSNQNLLQYQMTHNAFIFPYTLQYVGKIPFIYELKNIVLFGLGPFLGILSLFGVLFFVIRLVKANKTQRKQLVIIASFFFIYFYVVGSFAIGFMRYMLPIYPLLVLFAAVITDSIFQHIPNRFLQITIGVVLGFFLFIWPISFLHIYTQPNTRVQATEWILRHIPSNKTLAIEHWDDQIPLLGANQYKTVTLPLYDPDTAEKWTAIDSNLKHTDYIIIASNRLYTPLQRLSDCQKLFPHPCYQETARYYQKLFSGKLGFKKVAEFAMYPTIPFINIPINDQLADESFTVYDHPKIMIFKKE